MGLNLSLPKSLELKPRIVVIGVGGAGGNAVNNMISSGLDGVEFIVANTDAQALAMSKTDCRIQIGGEITEGLGAGMRPEVGEISAQESLSEIMEHLDGAHMLFVAAGMGGGTGTGAAPVIAQAARDQGILTVAIVTKPFQFEGIKRMKIAEQGLEKLYSSVDTLITIPNQNLFRVANESTTMTDAFAMADEVLHSGVRSITDLMVVPGQINLDFADVRTTMDEMGKAMMGTGEATGERRAIEAAESAISNPLLDDVSLKGAKGVLINITGGTDLTLYEVDEAASLIRGQVDEDANIIVGSAEDKDLDGIVRVSVVATGVASADSKQRPASRSSRHNQGVGPADMSPPASEYSEHMVQEPHVAPSPQPSMGASLTVRTQQSSAYQNIDSDMDAYTAPAAEMDIPPSVQSPSHMTTEQTPAPQGQQEKKPVSDIPAAPKPQTVVKRPFGFFGRKKQPVPIAPQPPVHAPIHTKPQNTGDLFGDQTEDEMDIPSFLRKHAN